MTTTRQYNRLARTIRPNVSVRDISALRLTLSQAWQLHLRKVDRAGVCSRHSAERPTQGGAELDTSAALVCRPWRRQLHRSSRAKKIQFVVVGQGQKSAGPHRPRIFASLYSMPQPVVPCQQICQHGARIVITGDAGGVGISI
jgi:hypothetical protein